ncbi:MAG: phage terminase large subunit [Myxococcota bacterium]
MRRSSDAEKARRSFPEFCQQAIKNCPAELRLGGPISWTRYLDAIATHLEAWVYGDFRFLLINVKNKSFKSGLGSVLLSAWSWLQWPELQWLTGSGRQQLAVDHCADSRRVLLSDWYQRTLKTLYGDEAWGLRGDQNAKGFYLNTCGGHRYTLWKPSGTGAQGSLITVDDPLQINEAHSEAENEAANSWTLQTVMSRFNNPDVDGLCVMQHRLRRDDTSGKLREQLGNWYEGGAVVTLSLPLEYKPAKRLPPTPIGWEDWRTEPGQSLDEKRWGPKVIAFEKATQTILYEALSNQDPKATGDRLVRASWFRRWTEIPPWNRLEVVTSWDLSFDEMDPTKPKKKHKRSKCCGHVYAFFGGLVFLLDRTIGHWNFIEQKQEFQRIARRWPRAKTHFVECKANGSALITEMRQEFPGTQAVNPDVRGGKYLRFAAVSHFIRAGNLYVPDKEIAPWAEDYIETLSDYPSVDFDEDIDCTSQALSEMWLPLDEEVANARQAAEGWKAVAKYKST